MIHLINLISWKGRIYDFNQTSKILSPNSIVCIETLMGILLMRFLKSFLMLNILTKEISCPKKSNCKKYTNKKGKMKQKISIFRNKSKKLLNIKLLKRKYNQTTSSKRNKRSQNPLKKKILSSMNFVQARTKFRLGKFNHVSMMRKYQQNLIHLLKKNVSKRKNKKNWTKNKTNREDFQMRVFII